MRIANRIVFVNLGVLVSAVGLADEIGTTDTGDRLPLAGYILPADPISEPQWRQSYSASEFVHANLSTRPLLDIEFRDSSTLKQLSKLRNLSFVTLAQKWNSRLFLGVNEDGLAGLHITLLPRKDNDKILELARLPYLKESQDLADSEQAETYSHCFRNVCGDQQQASSDSSD